MAVNVQTGIGMVDIGSYKLGPQIPLFGVEHKAATRVETDGVEIVYLEKDGFEVTKPFFWWVWDYTLGKLLSAWVLFKSIRLIHRVLRERIAKAEGEIERKKLEQKLEALAGRKTRQPVLDWARRNFGPSVMTELFAIRTSGFNSGSVVMSHFCQNVACSQALDDVYNVTASFGWEGIRMIPMVGQSDPLSRFHLDCPNGQSVRNRYRIVARLHEQLIRGETLSVACGSAQPLIHALSERKRQGALAGVSVLLADVDQSAIDLANHRAEQAGVRSVLIPLLTQFAVLPKALEGTSFDHIEACGIIDYLADDRVVDLAQMLHSKLKRGGTLLISQMSKTRAEKVLSDTYNWWIIYRSPEQFAALLRKAGFKDVTIYVEPWRVHMVALARKK
ncbi:class I SAM-dependent methyltransferase [Candidatus Uhrbacteria bacterium]|nr:class I SAM-dependent methyltransferase [Candidatus Uhrbacteria bacterium]